MIKIVRLGCDEAILENFSKIVELKIIIGVGWKLVPHSSTFLESIYNYMAGETYRMDTRGVGNVMIILMFVMEI